MASNFRLRRFSNPGTLKAISRPLLIEFLQPYREALTGQGFVLEDSERFDYDGLASILMSPDESMPDDMLDALFFVDEMSLPNYFDDLMTEAHAAQIDLGDSDEIGAADLAVRIWLADRQLLERLHAERFLIKPKSFQSFLSTGVTLPDVRHPADAVLQTLQDDLNDWFETHKRGRGTRVFPFFREDGVWFLVRHGEPYKREGTIKGEESSSVYYRPERFDVLIYNPRLGEFKIHAATKGEKKAYCKLLGKHIFGSETAFDPDRLDAKFTLEPIRTDGPSCLVCSDIDGIEEVRLTELVFRHDSSLYHDECHRSDDVFAALEERDRSVPLGARLMKAGFKVTFRDAVRPRTVVIRPPNVAIFDRDSDEGLLNMWMARRGFIPGQMGSPDVDAEAVLAVH